MDYDDPRWEGLQGGYRVFYDPCNALRSLENNKNVDEAWSELWNELHHQGDVGPASYAAVPELVRIHALRRVPDWNTYSIVAIVEEARRNRCNPEVPDWLRESYQAAWRQLIELGLNELRDAEEDILVSSIIGLSHSKKVFRRLVGYQRSCQKTNAGKCYRSPDGCNHDVNYAE